MLQSYNDLYRALNKYNVEYVVVGGMAVNLYGVIRTTKDIDLFVKATIENVSLLLKAMESAKFGTATLVIPEDVLKKDITIFDDILRIDVIIKMKSLDFESAWQRREVIHVKDFIINLICIDDLIVSKKDAGRDIDNQDVNKLEKVKKLIRGSSQQ